MELLFSMENMFYKVMRVLIVLIKSVAMQLNHATNSLEGQTITGQRTQL